MAEKESERIMCVHVKRKARLSFPATLANDAKWRSRTGWEIEAIKATKESKPKSEA